MTKQMNIRIDAETYRAFKAHCAASGKSVAATITDYVLATVVTDQSKQQQEQAKEEQTNADQQ